MTLSIMQTVYRFSSPNKVPRWHKESDDVANLPWKSPETERVCVCVCVAAQARRVCACVRVMKGCCALVQPCIYICVLMVYAKQH